MLASLFKYAVLLATVGEGVYLLWILHRKGVLRSLLTDPRVLAWAGLAAAAVTVCLWYARRIDLVKEGALPREALAPAQIGLLLSLFLVTVTITVAVWWGVGKGRTAPGSGAAPVSTPSCHPPA